MGDDLQTRYLRARNAHLTREVTALEARIVHLNDLLDRERKYIEDLYELRDYAERRSAAGY